MSNSTHQLFLDVYGQAYSDKIENLRRLLIENETGDNQFIVLPLEAGIGKSIQTDRIIGEYLASGSTRRFLIVKC